MPLQTYEGEVHLWYASLDVPADQLAFYSKLLSEDETARASRYIFDEPRNRYTTGRGILRTILCRYLSISPDQIAFTYGRQGKPDLLDPGDPPLRFNVAHTQAEMVIAVTHGRLIGVDIEYVRPLPDMMLVAERFFSEREVSVLRSLPDAHQPQAFFNAWTRKEAILKTYGDGISDALNTVEVSFAPGEPARVFSIRGDQGEAARWSICPLTSPTGNPVAAVVEGRIQKIDSTPYCYEII